MQKTNNKKIPLWLPYVAKIEIKKKTRLYFDYKGGEYEEDITKILSIMFYGGVCDLSENFLQLCVKYGVPICIHRRTMTNAIWITPSIKTSTKEDIITKQILFRENKKKCEHITRKILQAKFKSMEWLIPYPRIFDSKRMSIDEMRNMEAHHAKRYWSQYYLLLNLTGFSRRGKPHIVKSVLDAVSKLISGVILRYIIYHKMSPYHGFLHIPTDYPALVYDFMEPYRGYIEKIVFNTIKEAQQEKCEEKELLGRCISAVEYYLDSIVYTDATRQTVTFQELLHGIVLATRSYLQGISKQYIVPIPGKPNGGRPIKAGYKLYGRSAGPTDFWEIANYTSQKHQEKMRL